MDDASEPSPPCAPPYAGWTSVVSGLVALACALWVLLGGDVMRNLEQTPQDNPWLLAALAFGILGTLAGIVGLARREPLRLALLGLGVSLVAVLAKFFLVAFAFAIGVLVIVAVVGAFLG